MKLEIFTDGGCSGNPGPAAIGVVIKEGAKPIKTLARAIGQGTNNIAEYTALIVGLQEALILKADEVSVKTDSELMSKQVSGAYAVKPELQRVMHPDNAGHPASGGVGLELQ